MKRVCIAACAAVCAVAALCGALFGCSSVSVGGKSYVLNKVGITVAAGADIDEEDVDYIIAAQERGWEDMVITFRTDGTVTGLALADGVWTQDGAVVTADCGGRDMVFTASGAQLTYTFPADDAYAYILTLIVSGSVRMGEEQADKVSITLTFSEQ